MKAHYLEYGAGQDTIVLLASPLIRARAYWPAILALAGRFHVIAIDLPGAGPSDRLSRPWTDEAYADWLSGAFDALGIRAAAVIGHSNSGPMAIWLAAKHPARVSSLLLVDSVGASPGRSLWKTLVARVLTAIREIRFTLRSLPYLLFNLLVHSRVFRNQLLRSSRSNLLPVCVTVRVPLLLAWGARDRTMPLRSIQRFNGAMPQAAVVVNEKGDHDWIVVHAEEFAEMVRYFLGRELRIASVRYRRA